MKRSVSSVASTQSPVNSSGVLTTVVAGRTPDETSTRIRLHAPGPRGTLQTVLAIKKSANALLPKFTKSHELADPLVVDLKTHRKRNQRLTKLLDRLKKDTNKLLVGGHEMTDDQRFKILCSVSTAVGKAIETNATETDAARDTKKLQEALATLDSNARDFAEGLKRIEMVADSWKDVGWATNNPTAMGRGPPGHIAYSPFAQYRMPYDVTEVRKVNEEANKRIR